MLKKCTNVNYNKLIILEIKYTFNHLESNLNDNGNNSKINCIRLHQAKGNFWTSIIIASKQRKEALYWPKYIISDKHFISENT